jgi:hypothetical protein
VDWSVASALADFVFVLDFFLLAVDDVSLAAESGLAPVSDFALAFFLLELDLPAVDEVSLAESEPVVASDFALFVDFLLEGVELLEAAD